MPVSPQTLLALVRAARPTFRNKHDRVAFAVHAYMLADDYKLTGVGVAAEDPQGLRSDAAEVSLDGWTGLDNCYAFQYVDTTGKRLPILLKALVLEQKLLVHWVAPASQQAPVSVTLDTEKYASTSTDLTGGYQNLEDLTTRLHASFHGQRSSPGAEQASASDAQPASRTRDRGEHSSLLAEPDYERQRVKPGYGGHDVVPPGFRAPGMGGGFPGVPGMRGGGMHLGPDDPLFAGGLRHPPRPGSGLPGGARWDPVRPPGMEGSHPEDFQRSGRRGGGAHPDIAQPGPGTTDWDSMYG